MTDDNSKCSHCGARIKPSGRRSATLGKRYCMKRPCQAAKQRAYRATLRQEEQRIEDRDCFCCGSPVAPRSWRHTDSEVGRWCPRRECQRDRAARLSLMARVAAGDMGHEVVSIVARLFREMHERRRVACSGCGRLDAVPGYPHPTPDHSEACRETGTFPVTTADLPFAWPEEYANAKG